MREALRNGGATKKLDAVEDGEEALSLSAPATPPYTAAPKPDLIFLDLNLPKKDGVKSSRDQAGRKSTPDSRRCSYHLRSGARYQPRLRAARQLLRQKTYRPRRVHGSDSRVRKLLAPCRATSEVSVCSSGRSPSRVAVTVALPALAFWYLNCCVRGWSRPSSLRFIVAVGHYRLALRHTLWLRVLLLSATGAGLFFLRSVRQLRAAGRQPYSRILPLRRLRSVIIGLDPLYARYTRGDCRNPNYATAVWPNYSVRRMGSGQARQHGSSQRIVSENLRNDDGGMPGSGMDAAAGRIRTQSGARRLAGMHALGYFWDYEYRLRLPIRHQHVVLSRGIPVYGRRWQSRRPGSAFTWILRSANSALNTVSSRLATLRDSMPSWNNSRMFQRTIFRNRCA